VAETHSKGDNRRRFLALCDEKETSVRSTMSIRKIAVAAATALLTGVGVIGPITPAHAVDGITGATLSATTIAIPTTSPTTTDLTLSFTAPADDTVTYTATAVVKTSSSPVKKSKRHLPTVTVPATLTPGTANTLRVNTTPTTSRGKYTVTVVITQRVSGVATSSVTVRATVVCRYSADNSISLSSVTHVYYYKPVYSKLKVVAVVPKYMAGAKVKVVHINTETMAMKTIGSGKVSSKGKIVVKTKKAHLIPDFLIAITVKSRSYADSFTFGKVFGV
jgi:hypothetical protein